MVVEPASVGASVGASVRASARAFTHSVLNISKTTRPIAIKFCLKHLRGGGKVALAFRPGRVRTLVSMATDSPH